MARRAFWLLLAAALVGEARAKGPSLLLDLNRRTLPSSPAELTPFQGRLFFAATDRATGRELWATDGTDQGTVLVRDVNPGPDDSYPQYLTVSGGKLFFNASDGVHGSELWVTDGTADGTQLLKEIAAPRARTQLR